MKASFFCFQRKGGYYAIDTTRIIPVKINQAIYYALKQIEQCEGDIELSDFRELEGFENLEAL